MTILGLPISSNKFLSLSGR